MEIHPLMFMPGPIELIFIAGLVLGPLVLVGLIVLFVVRSGKGSPAQSPPCSKCGGWTVAGTRFCPHCGSRLDSGPPESGTG